MYKNIIVGKQEKLSRYVYHSYMYNNIFSYLLRQISKFSQEYAEKLSNMSDLIHSDQEKYGENLASGTFDDSYENIVKNAIKLWYSEKNSGVNGKGSFIFNFLDCKKKSEKLYLSHFPIIS